MDRLTRLLAFPQRKNFTTKGSRTRTIHTTDKAQTTASLEAIVLATRAGVRNPLLRHPPHPTPPRTPPQSPTPSRPTPPSPPDPPQSRNRLRPPPDSLQCLDDRLHQSGVRGGGALPVDGISAWAWLE